MGEGDTKKNDIHALPRISQPIKIIFIYTETENPAQADLNKGGYSVIETIDVEFASSDTALFRHVSAGSSDFWPRWGCLPSWVDFIVHGYPSCKLTFLKSPNQAQERMAIFFRNPGEHLLALCWLCWH